MNGPEELLRLLDEQIELLQRKHALLQRMGACVRQGDVAALADLLEKEGALVTGMDELAQRTQALRERMAQDAGLPPGEVTLGRIVATLTGPAAIAVNDCRERLQLAVQKLQEESVSTARLVRYALEFNNELLSALVGAGQEGSTYSAQGAVETNCKGTTFRHSA